MKTQTHFARVFSRAPLVRSVQYKVLGQPPYLLFETFGPPEWRDRKKSVLVFWNFTDESLARKFTLFVELEKGRSTSRKEPPVQIVASVRRKSFWLWTLDRLSAIAHGDEPPSFVCSHSAIGRV